MEMAVKTKTNLFYKLRLRETSGTFHPFSQRTSLSSLFKKYPRRFCVPLRSLVTEDELQQGHVFLGFTKCGQYLLSYQLKVLPQDSFPMLLFHYTLHWWQFCLRRPLKLFRSVPLFAGEEVDSYLNLIISQSPDERKVIVCGICNGNKEEASHMCYVTICAAPPKKPCPRCKACVNPPTSSGEMPRGCCLEHSFAIHFKYNLLPPFPIFNPFMCLQMEGVILFNTSDSLLALKVVASSSEEERSNYIKRLFMDRSESFEPASQNNTTSCFNSQNVASSVEEVEQGVHKAVNETCVSGVNIDATNGVGVKPYDADCPVIRKNDDDGILSSVMPERSNVFSETTISESIRDKNKHKNDLVHLQSYNSEQRACGESACESVQPCDQLIKDHQKQYSHERLEESMKGNHETVFDKDGDLPKKAPECEFGEQRAHRNSESHIKLNEDVENGVLSSCARKGTEESDDRILWNEKRDDSFDGSSSSPEVEPDANLTTRCFKVFSEGSISQDSLENPNPFDDFETILPVTVTAPPALNPLSCVCVGSEQSSYTAFENELSHCTSPFVTISQASLDVEQCICKLIESHDALCVRYKSLRDYDTEIIAVCPETANIIVLIKILVYVKGPEKKTRCGLPVTTSPSLKSTGFVFSWNIQTGQVNTLHNMELHDFSLKQHNSKFDLAAREAGELWRKVHIPRSIRTDIQIFSNHTVFSGKSLKYLKHPNLPFAVVLQ